MTGEQILILNTSRTGYAPGQCSRTMTVGELAEFLQQYDEDTKVYLAFDNGYTYGSVGEGHFEERSYDFEQDEFADDGRDY